MAMSALKVWGKVKHFIAPGNCYGAGKVQRFLRISEDIQRRWGRDGVTERRRLWEMRKWHGKMAGWWGYNLL
jgi:hypothetical protein